MSTGLAGGLLNFSPVPVDADRIVPVKLFKSDVSRAVVHREELRGVVKSHAHTGTF